jgi:hypothetical protein
VNSPTTAVFILLALAYVASEFAKGLARSARRTLGGAPGAYQLTVAVLVVAILFALTAP